MAYAAGDIGHIAAHNALIGTPLGALGYAPVTTAQLSVGTTITDLTGATVTVTVAAGRRIRITGFAVTIARSAVGTLRLYVRESTTTLGTSVITCPVNTRVTHNLPVILTPSAGAHTYKLSLNVDANTCETEASSTEPVWVLVEDIGV